MISWRKHYKRGLIAIYMLLSTSASIYAQGDAKNGEKLFKADCTACHALDKQLIGPALGGVVDRLKTEQNLDTDWLHKWIKDNEALRASGDKYANEVFEKFNKTAMLPFPNLSDQDIDDILEYTTNPPAPEPVADAASADVNSVAALQEAQKQSMNSKVILLSLLAIGGLLLWLLLKLRQLVKLQQAEELAGVNASRATSFADVYKKYHYIGKGILVVLGIFAAYGIWNWLMWIGVYKGYKPEQPIYFSHKIHAGENKIDCQLCHSSAKYGKVSEIPSMNVCMNCHRTISEYNGKYMEPGKDKEFYDGEIQKIYAATGWDPASQQYTGKTQPVEWTRIHNMPDFVYFNHSQHVTVGGIECQTCHGPVESMEIVSQHAPLTMGWCINCHRETDVKVENNEYYTKIHEQLSKKYGVEKLTVAQMGGLECGKCHY